MFIKLTWNIDTYQSHIPQVLNWVRDQTEKEPDLQHYVPHLQNNTILRLLQQVSFNLCLTISFESCARNSSNKWLRLFFFSLGRADISKH